MEIKELRSTDKGVKEIISDIDNLMNSLYAEESNQLVPLSELDKPNTYFIGAVKDTNIMACGALVERNGDDKYTELKRIYVKPECRGLKLSKLIMDELIEYSKIRGFKKIRLETGDKQHEAITLYESYGFELCSVFGSYRFDPTSVYMELSLY